jgi:hypothetical protein
MPGAMNSMDVLGRLGVKAFVRYFFDLEFETQKL